jgi:hypothetical protein
MALTTYAEVRPWAKAIRDEVLERRMPPWGAVKGFGEFQDDASLSQPEIDMIAGWVEGGAPEGDEIYLPAIHTIERPAPAPQPAGPPRRVTATATLPRAVTIAAIEPEGPLEALAVAPDGTVHPLIRWLGTKPRVFWLRQPLRLPAHSRLVVDGAALRLFLKQKRR